jgi:hypothetical protein
MCADNQGEGEILALLSLAFPESVTQGEKSAEHRDDSHQGYRGGPSLRRRSHYARHLRALCHRRQVLRPHGWRRLPFPSLW